MNIGKQGWVDHMFALVCYGAWNWELILRDIGVKRMWKKSGAWGTWNLHGEPLSDNI